MGQLSSRFVAGPFSIFYTPYTDRAERHHTMTQTNTGGTSVAQITVPSTQDLTVNPLPRSSGEVPFDLLRDLLRDMEGLAQDHQVIALIHACIEAGVHEGTRLTGIIHHLGFNRRYVGKLLSEHKGNDPARHYWYKDVNELYQLLDQPDA